MKLRRGIPLRLAFVGLYAALLVTSLALDVERVRASDPPAPQAAGSTDDAPGPEGGGATTPATPSPRGPLNLSGSLAVDGRWMSGPGTPGDGITTRSDLYIRKIELAVDASLLKGVSVIAVVNSEWLGDGLNGGDGGVAIDEAHCDLGGEHVYLVVGQRTQPFGVFENNLVTDPLTQDGYEIKRPGATLGVRGPLESDASLTLYSGNVLRDHFLASNLVDGAALAGTPADGPDHVSSFIAAAAFSPLQDLVSISGAIDSEPGANERNMTANVTLQLTPRGTSHLMAEAEFIRALSREARPGSGRAFRETAGSIGVGYSFSFGPRRLRGSGNYWARVSHLIAHPVLVGVRYEFLDDDGYTEVSGVSTIQRRVSIGGRYSFHEEARRSAYASAEYRRTQYRAGMSHGAESGGEVYLRLGIAF
jgi:hypothetical protein